MAIRPYIFCIIVSKKLPKANSLTTPLLLLRKEGIKVLGAFCPGKERFPLLIKNLLNINKNCSNIRAKLYLNWPLSAVKIIFSLLVVYYVTLNNADCNLNETENLYDKDIK